MASNTFKMLLEEVENTPGFHMEGFKIEFAEEIWLWMERNIFQTKKLLAAEKLGITKQKLTMILKGNCDLKLSEVFNILFVIKRKLKLEKMK